MSQHHRHGEAPDGHHFLADVLEVRHQPAQAPQVAGKGETASVVVSRALMAYSVDVVAWTCSVASTAAAYSPRRSWNSTPHDVGYGW